MNALTGQFSDPVEQVGSEQIESFLSPGENASEGEKLAKLCGGDVTRLSVEPGRFVQALYDLGEVMALTGNDSAVHRKHGVYDNVHVNRMHTIVLNRDIDLRIFMKQWTNIFSVTQHNEEGVKRSFQIFNNQGKAVHKIYMKPGTDVDAFDNITKIFRSDDQSTSFEISPPKKKSEMLPDESIDLVLLQDRWANMTDVHQFQGILRKLKCTRHQAVRMVGDEFAEQLEKSCLPGLLHKVLQLKIPIMCFVGSEGCIQIHTGPISRIREVDGWFNVLDENFHLHLRLADIHDIWLVRKPTDTDYVSSIEVYNKDHELIVQFFGRRTEKRAERSNWRAIVTEMPRVRRSCA